jgi:hypothetical protein
VAPKSGGVDDDLIDTTLEHLVQGHYFGTSQPSHQGDQTSLRKSRPKCSPTDFFVNGTVKKSSPKFCATSAIFKPLPKEKNRLMSENSPNLVTLHVFE